MDAQQTRPVASAAARIGAVLAGLLLPAASLAVADPAEDAHPRLLATLVVLVAITLALGWLLRRTRQQLNDARHAVAAALAGQNPLLAALPDVVWLKDPGGTYLACNPAFCALCGREPGDIVGRRDTDILKPALARAWRNHDRAAIEAGRAVDDDQWVTFSTDGHSALLRVSRTPIYDDDGKLVGVMGVGRDITREHQAEAELKKRSSYQRALLDNFPFMVWLKDTEGRFRAVNQPFADAAGFDDPADLIRKTDFDVWPDELARSHRAEDRSVMANRCQREAEEQIDDRGQVKWFETYKAPVLDDAGQMLGTVGFARDVSERREMEAALRQSEARFRSFFENNSSVMILVDAESGLINEANRAAVEFYGYSEVELTNMLISEINVMPPELIAGARREALEQRRSLFHFTHRLAGGELRDVDVYSTPITIDDSELLFSVVHDVTDRKRAELALQQERDLFSAGPVAVFTWSTEPGRPVLQVSSNVIDLLGYTPAEITAPGFRFDQLVHPDDLGRMRAAAEGHLASGVDRFEQSYRLRRKHAGYAWYHDFTHVARTADGAVASIRGYLFDQTQIKELELRLEDERKRLKYVIEGTGVGTWEWNVQTGETRFNERWAEIIGYRLNELVPVTIDTWMRFAHPDDLKTSETLLQRHFAGESEYYACEARMRHRDGHWVWVLDRGRVFEWTEDGKPLWMYGTHQEITDRKQAEAAMRENEHRWRIAGRTSYDLIYEWDLTDNSREWFGDIDAALGYPPDTITSDNDAWLALIHPQDRDRLQHSAGRQHDTSRPVDDEYRIRRHDGEYRVWRDKRLPLSTGQGQKGRWIGVCTDITEQKLADEKQRLAGTVFEHAHEGIVITDADANIVDANAAFTVITGYDVDEVVGRNPRFLSSGRQDDAFYAAMWQSLNENDRWVGEIWNRRRNGEVYAEMLSITAVRDSGGEVSNYVALFSDITAQKAHQDQLEHIAYYDTLTDLPNRLLLGDRLQRAMIRARRHDRMLAVVYLDLDGFKPVNDHHGHDVGDRFLVEIAGRLKKALRDEDTVARLGGDEFVAVLVDLKDAGACIDLLPRLLAAAAQPTSIDGRRLNVSASLGVTLYPQTDAVDADQLLRQADQAMYQAKLAGKNRYHFFDAEQDRSIRGQVEILEQIKVALEADEFVLHYQPKVNMRSGEVIGAEALIRWPLPHGGLRQPAEFLPYVENHPLAATLDAWVIDKALSQLRHWQTQGLEVSISVNVTAYHLQQADFIDRLHGLLNKHPDVDPGRLIVEVLETTALMDLTRVSEVIRAGQALGVVFALDDFGTGYSSLNYLKNLPARQLKIDRSFVRNMLDDRDDLAILEGIMGLATAFDREAVAEGVESVEHGEILLQLGCSIAQGYGIGKPMPADQFPRWAAAWEPDPLWRQQRPVARDDLPLIFAMVEHRAWIKAVESQLNGAKLPCPPMGEEQCNFARWLHGDGPERVKASPQLARIQALHTQVHAIAPELLRLHRRGDAQATRTMLTEMHRLRDELLAQLKGLLRRQ